MTRQEEYRVWNLRATRFGGGALVASLILAGFGFGQKLCRVDGTLSTIKLVQAVVLAAWIVLPPIWFWIEFWLLYLPIPKDSRESLEEFKYGQEVNSKIWLALVTALFGLYFGKDLRG